MSVEMYTEIKIVKLHFILYAVLWNVKNIKNDVLHLYTKYMSKVV